MLWKRTEECMRGPSNASNLIPLFAIVFWDTRWTKRHDIQLFVVKLSTLKTVRHRNEHVCLSYLGYRWLRECYMWTDIKKLYTRRYCSTSNESFSAFCHELKIEIRGSQLEFKFWIWVLESGSESWNLGLSFGVLVWVLESETSSWNDSILKLKFWELDLFLCSVKNSKLWWAGLIQNNSYQFVNFRETEKGFYSNCIETLNDRSHSK